MGGSEWSSRKKRLQKLNPNRSFFLQSELLASSLQSHRMRKKENEAKVLNKVNENNV